MFNPFLLPDPDSAECFTWDNTCDERQTQAPPPLPPATYAPPQLSHYPAPGRYGGAQLIQAFILSASRIPPRGWVVGQLGRLGGAKQSWRSAGGALESSGGGLEELWRRSGGALEELWSSSGAVEER